MRSISKWETLNNWHLLLATSAGKYSFQKAHCRNRGPRPLRVVLTPSSMYSLPLFVCFGHSSCSEFVDWPFGLLHEIGIFVCLFILSFHGGVRIHSIHCFCRIRITYWPISSKIGPISHHSSAKFPLLRRIVFTRIYCFAENVIDFVAVQHTRPFRPWATFTSMSVQVHINIQIVLCKSNWRSVDDDDDTWLTTTK